MHRALSLLALLSAACGSSAPTASTSTTPAAHPDDGLPVEPSRALLSLDPREHHALAEWLRAHVPFREVACADGHTATSGFRASESDDDVAGPTHPAPSDPPECTRLTVADWAGCQVAAAGSDPCDLSGGMALWAPGAACGAVAACVSAGFATSME